MPILPLNRREIKRDPDREKGPYENPWKEIEGTVRKVDEEKVKDCTDDIDTLLVFAGLYSAVLTAFLIESYKNLFADESETLLRQMVLQSANYKFTNGYLNSTFDPSQLPPFKAAVSDIRVNVCWFASLILSLSSASFGIAVKQWLREFLAIDCINPQERLRIRDARIHGLADWKLFQIAAFLPILLQVSLVLFFVGLCFFTAAVHRSIGITSLFLVSCWAFLFFMSVLAPLFSPRCPYKTTILKVPFRYARPRMQAFLRYIYQSWCPPRLLQCLCGGTPESVISIDTDSEDMHRNRSSNELQYFDDYMDLGILSMFSAYMVDEDTMPEEEDTIRRTDGKDLVILWNIDTTFLDDSLLACMPQALSQHLPLPDVVRFITTVIWHRSGSSFSAVALEKPRRREWPWTLSPRARVALADMLVESIEYELLRGTSLDWSKLSRMDSEWSRSVTLLILLLPRRETIPHFAIRLFEGLNDYYSKHRSGYNPYDVFAYQVRTLAQVDPDWPARSLLFLAQSITTLKIEEAEDCVRQIAQAIFVKPCPPSNDTYRVLLERKPHDDYDDGDVIVPTPQTMLALLEVARVILDNFTLEQTHVEDRFPERIGVLLVFVFDLFPRLRKSRPSVTFDMPLTPASDRPGLKHVLAGLFTTPHTTHRLLHFLATHPRSLYPLSQLDNKWLFSDLIDHPNSISQVGQVMVLAACTNFFMAQASSPPFIVDSLATLLHLSLFVHTYPTRTDEGSTAGWQSFFFAVHACYKRIVQHESYAACRYPDEQHTDLCETARLMLNWNTKVEARVPNEMVKVLMTFVCETHTFDQMGHKFRLIGRLEQAEQAENAIEELQTCSEEAGSDGPVLVQGPPAVFTHGHSIDSRPHGESSVGLGEDSVSRGPAATETASLGAAMSTSPETPAQSAAIGDKFGVHDRGERVLESLRSAGLEKTAETMPQTHDSAETIDGSPGLHSISRRRASLSEPSVLHENLLSVLLAAAPDDIEAIGSQTTALNASPRDINPVPTVTAGGHCTPSEARLRLPAVVPLFDDDAVPKLRNVDVDAATHTSRSVTPIGREDEATPLLSLLDGEGGDKNVAGSREEGSEQLVALDSSGRMLRMN